MRSALCALRLTLCALPFRLKRSAPQACPVKFFAEEERSGFNRGETLLKRSAPQPAVGYALCPLRYALCPMRLTLCASPFRLK